MTAPNVLVIKCGGSTATEPAALCSDVAGFVADGRPVIIVHGGSADIERLAARLRVPMRRLVSPEGHVHRPGASSRLLVNRRKSPAPRWPPGPAGPHCAGSGCGYRGRDRRDSMSEPAMDTSLPSSGISSSPAR